MWISKTYFSVYNQYVVNPKKVKYKKSFEVSDNKKTEYNVSHGDPKFRENGLSV